MVFVDGEARGTTPLSNLALSPGLHRARLVKDDEDMETIGEEEVLVERGRSKHYDRGLASRNGVIQLESDPPGAQVSLVGEGGLVVEVPRTTPLLVSARAGRYRARFELEGFEPQERVAQVSPAGAQARCSVVWERGEFVFETTQEGLQVEVFRGARAGVGAPLRSLALPLAGPLLLPPGVYSVRAHRMEHDRRDRDNLVLLSGGTTRVRLWLAPIERRLDFRLGSNWCLACAIADLDGDGLPEIAASPDTASSFTIFSSSGAPLREIDARGAVRVLATADLDGNGLPEFVAGTNSGRLLAVDGEGARTLDVETGSEGIVSLRPVDLDGRPPTEVVAATSTGRILAFSADGRPLYSARARGGSYSHFIWSTRTGGTDLIAADLDGDGREEVVAGTTGGQILVLRPDGSTLWSREVEGWVTALAASDLDGNGPPEILATTQTQRFWPSSGRLLAFRANGDPLFDEELPGFSHTVLATDLDGDGRPEIVAGETGGRILALRANDRSVLFRHEAGEPAMSLLAIDLDGDGRRELLAGLHSGGILALESDGSRRFQVPARARVFDLFACDLDADGKIEVLARVAEDQILAIVPRVDRLFEIRLDDIHGALVAGDLDGDRRTELVTGSSGGQLLASGPEGDSLWERDVGGEVRAIVVRDGEGIGKPEVLVGTQRGAVLAFGPDGSPRFDMRANGAVSALVVADLDGDGRAEIVASTEGGEVRAFGADGGERFATAVGSAVRSPEFRGARLFSAPLAAADLDGDGRAEILAGTEKGEIVALAGNGSPLADFAAPRLGEPVALLVAANLDGNGRSEVVAATVSGRVLAVAPDGTTLFTREAGREVVSLLAVDLDADRRDEIVTARGPGRILVYGPGGEDRLDRATGNNMYSVLAADTDGDGRRELVASTMGLGISVYALDGTRRYRTDTRRGIFTLILADFDGDGTPEIAGEETGALVGAYRIRADDPRPAARRAFMGAIEAAERGDEEAAALGFATAGLGWLALDDVGLGALRDRLGRLESSGSARRMAGLLDRARPASAREWWEGIVWLAGRGEMGEAVALARAHRVETAKDGQIGLLMNDYAWRFVDPTNPRPEGFELALALAETAVEATGRRALILDTLAHALDANGRLTDAVKIEEEALARCLPGDEQLRGTLEAALARFRDEAGKAPPAPAPLPRPGAGHSGR